MLKNILELFKIHNMSIFPKLTGKICTSFNSVKVALIRKTNTNVAEDAKKRELLCWQTVNVCSQ